MERPEPREEHAPKVGRAGRKPPAELRRGLASPTPTEDAPLAGFLLTHNPSRSTVEPESGGYLGDVG